ncbi:hypothetical protein [Rhodococcus sp. BH5]|uniref:hypothetical protein n=1 Tax=Rhodococcus sp. BH5 TaxID=2871702 RepID=UPI0022CD3185|nr:hypothetical protein [Rhodococcus sp. BH5]MCZ9635038.1 hypothetical protein [Rhodococcus sp. BH5]
MFEAHSDEQNRSRGAQWCAAALWWWVGTAASTLGVWAVMTCGRWLPGTADAVTSGNADVGLPSDTAFGAAKIASWVEAAAVWLATDSRAVGVATAVATFAWLVGTAAAILAMSALAPTITSRVAAWAWSLARTVAVISIAASVVAADNGRTGAIGSEIWISAAVAGLAVSVLAGYPGRPRQQWRAERVEVRER